MTILAIDTSGVVCSAALLRNGRLLGEVTCRSGRNHSVQLMPLTEELLVNCGLSLGEVEAFAAVVGPGSFTGIRIGVSAVKGLAKTLNRKCVGVDALELMAANAPFFRGIVCPMIDARAQQVYSALFRPGEIPERLSEDRAIRIGDLLNELAAGEENILFLGDAVYTMRSEIEAVLGNRAFFAPESLLMPRAAVACALAEQMLLQGQETTPEMLSPIYVKASQAEREEKAKAEQAHD